MGASQTLGFSTIDYTLCSVASWCHAIKNVATSKSQPTSVDQLPTKINAYQQADTSIVDLDESVLAQDIPRKQWLLGKGRVNAMGALMGLTFLTVVLFDGRLNGDVVYAWLTQDLLAKTVAR